MTRIQAEVPGFSKKRRATARVLIGGPLVVLLGFLSLISLSWTGWGFETDPAAQLLRDAPFVVLAGLTGALAGAVLAWTVTGRESWRWPPVLSGRSRQQSW